MGNLTKKEMAVLKGIADSDYMNVEGYDDKYLINCSTWMFDALHYSGLSGKEFSGVCSSLHKKGFIGSDTTGDPTMISVKIEDTHEIWMTEKGFEALNANL